MMRAKMMINKRVMILTSKMMTLVAAQAVVAIAAVKVVRVAVVPLNVALLLCHLKSVALLQRKVAAAHVVHHAIDAEMMRNRVVAAVRDGCGSLHRLEQRTVA